MDRAFDLSPPREATTAFVFASPHSGRQYPRALMERSRLSARELRSSEDAFVDRLFASAPLNGAWLMSACLPRAWVDLNRAPHEFDPALIAGMGRSARNARVASGLGVVPRVVSGGRPIYDGKITMEEAEARIEAVWRPYHGKLREILDGVQDAFGRSILIDCHSMPKEALDGVRVGGKRPDVVLGDRFGGSAATEIVDLIAEVIEDAGLVVSRNAPFAGAYNTQHYGKPSAGRHVVQVEINRSLYMDEATITPHEGFGDLRERIDGIVSRLCEFGRPANLSLAAE